MIMIVIVIVIRVVMIIIHASLWGATLGSLHII